LNQRRETQPWTDAGEDGIRSSYAPDRSRALEDKLFSIDHRKMGLMPGAWRHGLATIVGRRRSHGPALGLRFFIDLT
jgi:hypothetical protein